MRTYQQGNKLTLAGRPRRAIAPEQTTAGHPVPTPIVEPEADDSPVQEDIIPPPPGFEDAVPQLATWTDLPIEGLCVCENCGYKTALIELLQSLECHEPMQLQEGAEPEANESLGRGCKRPHDTQTECTTKEQSLREYPAVSTSCTNEPQSRITMNQGEASTSTAADSFIMAGPSLSSSSSPSPAKRVCRNDYDDLECNRIESAFKGRIFNSKIENTAGIMDPTEFLNACKGLVIKEIESTLKMSMSGLKMSCSMNVSYLIQTPDNEKVESIYFNSKTKEIQRSSNLDAIFRAMKNEILENLACFEGQASSKTLFAIHSLVNSAAEYNPLCASGYVELPACIKRKKAVVNIRNNDDFCFAWCMLASRYPAKRHTDRPSSYPGDLLLKAFNYDGITFPFPLNQIERFEKQNPEISIAVFALNANNSVESIRKPSERKASQVNLLMVEEGDKSHYCLISSISRLVRSQITKSTRKMWLCEACMKRFPNEEALRLHKLKCNKCQNLKMPMQGEVLEFNAFSKSAPVPFVIYADIESVLRKVHSCEPSDSQSWTRTIQEHEAISIALKVICRHDQSLSRFKLFRGDNALNDFFSELKEIADEVIAIYNHIVPMHMTPQDKLDFDNAAHCHICLKGFAIDDLKARDHCHLSGTFLGACHNACNLNRKLPNFIPIFFHCLSNYDSHFLIRHMAYDNGPVSCIAQSSERYLAFSKWYKSIQFRFLDSYKFLDDKLSSLADMLSDDDFKVTNAEYSEPEHLELMKCKGIFPYTYLDAVEKLQEEELPPKELFDDISEEEYAHALKVWRTFDIKNLGEYSDLYLKTDTLLLADVFEKFRDLSLEMYHLDPAWYYTLPSLAFDAMLKTTKVKLDLLSDVSMVEFFEEGIRGGLCTVSKRYSKANHEYMSEYNSEQPSNFLAYFDINNLYGHVMAAKMPQGNLRWLERTEIDTINFAAIPEDSKTGYVLEVDLEYPDHLHDAHNDLPLCPRSEIPPGSQYKKLIASLENKSKYVLHYKILQQCLDQGLLLRHIHRAVSYDQSEWLKVYIDLNAEKRARETSKFGQNLWKKMNNAVYGKFIENVRKYRDFRIVPTWKQARKLTARPTYVRSIIFNENLVGIELAREEILMNKPIYIGQAILDLSKFVMYDFFYNVLKPQLNGLVLNYMDTDSFILETSSDIYQFMKTHPQYFDTSNYDHDNAYGIKQANKKKIGLFKDELGGRLMTEYVGLRAKLYSYRYDHHTVMKAKGITKGGMRTITFDKYFDCLKDLNKKFLAKQICFRSSKHKISTVEINKIALHGGDTKRKMIDGSHETLAWGHYSLRS